MLKNCVWLGRWLHSGSPGWDQQTLEITTCSFLSLLLSLSLSLSLVLLTNHYNQNIFSLAKKLDGTRGDWRAHNQPVSSILKASGVSSVSNDAPRQCYVLSCPALVDNLGRREGGERGERRVENNNKHILMGYKTFIVVIVGI